MCTGAVGAGHIEAIWGEHEGSGFPLWYSVAQEVVLEDRLT